MRIIAACIGIILLVVGVLIGWFAGRAALEKQWGNPYAVITGADETRAKIEGADPTPKAGTKILRPLPLLKAREIAASLTANDPLKVTLAVVGRDDDDIMLHLNVTNAGKCKATAFSGVAYGFDAFGKSVKLNKAGEHYLAFATDKQPLEAGESDKYEWKLKSPETASLVVAHIDEVTCEGGTKWTRN
jgi:hypothetical protein